MLLASLAVAVSPDLRGVSIRTSLLSAVPGGEALVRIDALSSALLPFAAGLWLLTVAVTPRTALDRAGLRRTALATLITLAAFLTESAVILLLFLEMFVPSGGLIGGLAGVSALGSIFAFFQHDTTWGLVSLGLYLVLGPIAIVFMFKLWLNSSMGRGMILGGDDAAALDPEGERLTVGTAPPHGLFLWKVEYDR